MVGVSNGVKTLSAEEFGRRLWSYWASGWVGSLERIPAGDRLVEVRVGWVSPLAAPAIPEPTPHNLTRTRGRETLVSCS
jgi:hypothetical protein